MSFYRARLAALFSPSDASPPIRLVTYNTSIFTELPTQEWELPTDSRNFAASDWAQDIPTGNAKLSLTFDLLCQARTMAALQAELRRTELALAQHRAGTLTIDEAYHNGTPTISTVWQAVVTSISTRSLLAYDDALCDPSSDQGAANASLSITFTLTNGTARDVSGNLLSLATNAGNSDAVTNGILLDARHVPTGLLASISVSCRTSKLANLHLGIPLFLSVWEQNADAPAGDTTASTLIATSCIPTTQSLAVRSEWLFNRQALHARPLYLLFHSSATPPTTTWDPAAGFLIGLRTSAGGNGDLTKIYSNLSTYYSFIPELTINYY